MKRLVFSVPLLAVSILIAVSAFAVVNGTTVTTIVSPDTAITSDWIPSFATPSCGNGTQGSSHNCNFSVAKNNNDTSALQPVCTITAGSIPAGQTVSCSGITGTPTAAGAVSATIRACVGLNCTYEDVNYTIASSGSGTITAALAASRTSGPAPLAVRFDAIGTTHSGGLDTFREVYYEFTFDDAGSGNWPNTSDSRNTERGGPIAAHVFESAGSYTVTVTAVDASGITDTETVSITVSDPDTYYSGTNTVCVSPSSNYTGCPSGASQLTAMPTPADGKRYLLHAGESYGGISFNFVDNWQLGRYGTGSDPAITSDIKVNSSNPGSSTAWSTNGVVMNMNVSGAITQEVSAENILFFRNTSTKRYRVGGALEYYFGANGSNSNPNYTWPKNIFIVENYLDLNNDSTEPVNVWMYADGAVIAGNDFRNPNEHTIRTPLLYKTFIGHNYLTGIGASKHFVKIHAIGKQNFASSLATANEPATQYVVVGNNIFGNGTTDYSAQSVAACPKNETSDEGVQDVIVEDNYFAVDPIQEIVFGGKRLTSRDDNTGTTSIVTGTGCKGDILGTWDGPYYLNQNVSQFTTYLD